MTAKDLKYFLIHFTTDTGRYLAPPVVLCLTLLLAKNQGYWQGSSMRATSETEISIVILAPLATFLGILSGRSANLRSSFIYGKADGSLLRASVLGSVASASWLIIALTVIWASASVRAAQLPGELRLHLGVFFLDVVVLVTASSLGHHIARKVDSLWWQVLVPLGIFVVLNVIYYIPENPALVLIPRSNYSFFATASHNPIFLLLQGLWVGVLGVALLALSTRVRRGLLLLTVIGTAGLLVTLAVKVPPYTDAPVGTSSEFSNSTGNS